MELQDECRKMITDEQKRESQDQCHTQSSFGHTGTCTRSGNLTKVLESALSDRQPDKHYGSI